MLGRCDVCVLSVACIASGSSHTYHSCEVHTTVDYICGDLCAASMACSCHTLATDDLNTTDHLPFA